MGRGMANPQAKTEQLGVRVTREEKGLIEDLAVARGTTIDGIIREHGVEVAVRIARDVRDRMLARAESA